MKTLRTLFTSTFMISLIMIGGGYVGIALVNKRFVDQLGWLTEEEMTDLTALSASMPGAIAVNLSIAVGYKIARVRGAICALVGTTLPPVLSIVLVQMLYMAFLDNPTLAALFRGMNAVTAAVMLNVVWEMGSASLKENRALGAVMMALVFALVLFTGLSAVTVMLGSIIFSVILAFWAYVKRTRKAVGK